MPTLKWPFRLATLVIFAILANILPAGLHAQPGRLLVKVNQPGPKISPTLYGLMTEEISHSYDGGLYAELIRNRAFKDNTEEPVDWTLVEDGGGAGSIALDQRQPLSMSLQTTLRLTITTPGQRVGVANDGYWGIPVRPNTRYRASLYARGDRSFTGPLTVDIESADGSNVLARAEIPKITSSWAPYSVTLTTGDLAPSETNRFVVSTSSPGTLWLDLVSLFPPTYHDRPNGNRIDIMQKLAGLNPSFLRFPGGNYLEGNSLDERFEWRNTIGPLWMRPGHESPWGYRSSDGLGLLEYLEWCEDLHMQPVLAVFDGYVLNGTYIEPGPRLQPWVQDALDEIEYATGAVTTRWGAVRARDGHPAPFHVNYVEIGNEDYSHEYNGRFAQFFDAIKAKYPHIKLIATSRVTSRVPDVVDDHYYRSAAAMEADVHHYDNSDRHGPKIFVGEWATTEGRPTPTFQAALADAAWMTGLENNSDVVILASYAPLFVNVNPGASQWGTNFIGYDALNSFGSTSYYAQQMFSQNRGDVVLPVDLTVPASPAPAPPAPHGAIGVATWETQAEFRNIKVTHNGQTLYQKDFANGDADWHFNRGAWKLQDGALVQTSDEDGPDATAGDLGWTDYTYSLQARKISGREGFLIMFHYRNNGHFVWWNVGGWGNTRTGLERVGGGGKGELGRPSPVTVETGRWYNIRIELNGDRIRCYLDDKLVTEATDTPPPPVGPLFATASRDKQNGDIILKLVNVSAEPQPLQIDLAGAGRVDKTASALVLTGMPDDQNSLADPLKVAPKSEPITNAGPIFTHTFPAYSVNVIRLKTR
ncbi:MAG TPA: alpha-L-arabinofuranosidase C-terminal domain-containing protein [Armatimonadota bacterium]|nr:alpha-L-arabinofuranosidase C-terminal domain-containing protein [Armatimonadota bacterium]